MEHRLEMGQAYLEIGEETNDHSHILAQKRLGLVFGRDGGHSITSLLPHPQNKLLPTMPLHMPSFVT